MKKPNEFMAEQIRKLREELGWSREKLSEMSEIPTRTIQDIETKVTKDPGVQTIAAIIKALGAPASSFFIDSDSGKGHIPSKYMAIKGMKSTHGQEVESKRKRASAEVEFKMPSDFTHSKIEEKSWEELVAGVVVSLPALNKSELRALSTRINTFLSKRPASKSSSK